MVKNQIKVFARLKPEKKKKNTVNYQIHRRPKESLEEDYLVLNGAPKSSNEYVNNRPESWNFAFHKIFDDLVEQREIFETVAQPVVHSVLNGYNATIFAYGQTGSGKTYSITGDAERYEDRGVLPRTVQYLFEAIQKNPEDLYSVEIAYLEIYNENGYDLLDPQHEVVKKLEDLPRVTIQEDETGKLHLKNLNFRRVEDEKEALALLFLGDTNRAISETPMNPQSSRSHCIFTISVSVKQSGAQHVRRAKMHLVDLAGSERVYKCCISGSILTEAKHINLSLHYLEQVIVCLGQQNVTHIPYRNSLLTAILRDSLGGNCLTTMLATLSLNTSNLEETISTCRFSQRVALIKNDVNLVLERNAEDENRFLRMEVERLRNQISQLTKRPAISEVLSTSEKLDMDHKIGRFVESGQEIDWDNDDRKIRYCLKVLRDNFGIKNYDKRCVEEDGKDLKYYRNLVVQRDKEISALIDMLKKARSNSSDNSALDSASFDICESKFPETTASLTSIAKKIRLRDLMTEARSIAELIKSGKASIDDLKTRMSKKQSDPAELQTLHETLLNQQSELARNLVLLKTLKSETMDLTATPFAQRSLINENEHPGIIARKDDDKKTLLPGTETDRKTIQVDAEESHPPTFPSSRVENHDKDTSEIFFSKISSPSQKGHQSMRKEDLRSTKVFKNRDLTIVCPPKTNRTDLLGIPRVRSEDIQVDVEGEAPRSTRSDSDGFVNANSPGPRDGESFVETKTSTSRESRPSSFRAPAFLREMMMRPLCDSGDGPTLCSVETNVNPTPRDVETLNTVAEIVRNFRDEMSKSESKDEVLHDSRDHFKACEREEDASSGDVGSINGELGVDGKIGNVEDLEDDVFVKSLPLTGDPEIDEEIVAFYRAKRSGGTY